VSERPTSPPPEVPFRPHPIAWTPEKIGRLWDYYASTPAYDAHYFSRHSGGSILDFVRRHVSLAGRHVLDFGCGPGFMLERILEEGITASGLEFSKHSAEAARRLLQRFPNFRGVTIAELLPSQLPDASFDAVLCIEVLEHLFPEQVAPTLAEARRLLAPGGLIVATTPNEELLASETLQCPDCGCEFHRWQHLRQVDAESMTRLMRDAGFTPIVCQPTRFGPRRRRRLSRRLKDYLRRLTGSDRSEPTPHLIFIGRRD